MANKFDRNGFIEAASQQGYSSDEINAYLTSVGQKPIGMVEGLVRSPLLPVAGGVAGGVGGAIAGIPFLGAGAIPGAAFGGAVGTGAGYAARQSLSDLLGYGKKDFINQQLPEIGTDMALGGAAAGGTAALGTAGLAGLSGLKKIIDTITVNPQLLKLSQQRAPLEDKVNIDTKALIEAGKAAENQAGTPEVAQKIRELFGNLYSRLTPITGEAQNSATGAPMSQLKGTTAIKLSDMYERLKALEADTRAYGGSAANSQAGNYISKSVRDLANKASIEQGFPDIAKINARMSDLYKLQPARNQIGQSATRFGVYGALGAGLGGLGLVIKKLFGGN